MHLGLILIMYNALGLFIVPNPTPLTITLNIEVILKVGLPMFVGTGLVVASMFASKKSGNVSAVSFSTVFTGYAISIIRYGEIPNILGVAGSICIGVGLFLVLFK
jgi:drug/metabolite transporter (DMT)-like permease